MTKNTDIFDGIGEWLDVYKRNSVKPTTYDRLVTSKNSLHDYPIAMLSLREVGSDDVQHYVNELVRDGYAHTTIKKQYGLVTSFLKYAYANGYLSRPIYGVKLPSQSSVRKKKRDVAAYSEIEEARLRVIFETLETPLYGAALLMLETGMRVGEVLALTWDDIFWGRRAVRINKTLIRITNESDSTRVQEGAKSYFSNRLVPLSERAISVLRRLGPGDGYIFANDRGDPITYEALRWQIQKACKRARVEYRGMHIFRHTFATNCYKRGCDVKILSKLLGHADVTITYNVYIHLFGDALDEMRKVIG